MPKLFLHIGAEKTGTTSIQRALNKNRKALRAQGLMVAGKLGRENHKMLVAYALPLGSKDIALRSQGVADDKKAYADYCRQIETAVQQEVKSCDVEAYCISSEDFHRLQDKQDLEKLAALLTPLFDEIEIVFFVRRQDRLATSRFNTMVQFGYGRAFSFAQILKENRQLYYDYAALLERYQGAFPGARITVVPYGQETQNADKSSVQLFAEVVGKTIEEPKQRFNVSYDTVDLRLIQILWANRDMREELDPIKFFKTLPNDGPGPKLPARPDEARDFVEAFKDSNDLLASRYLGGNRPFNDDYSAYDEDYSYDAVNGRAQRRLLKALLRARTRVHQLKKQQEASDSN